MRNRNADLVWMTIVGCVVALLLFFQPWALSGEAKRMSDECDKWERGVQLLREGAIDPKTAKIVAARDVEDIRFKLEADARKNRDAWAEALDYRKARHYVVPATLDWD